MPKPLHTQPATSELCTQPRNKPLDQLPVPSKSLAPTAEPISSPNVITLAPATLEAGLYVVATPIGNLADITLRAISVLRAADVIACEDTRHTRPLLERYEAHAPRIALHAHNERAVTERIIAAIRAGHSVALVSDAGTPAIADPGARTVHAVRAAGFSVFPIPGANAAVTALCASGFDQDCFSFLGFLPARVSARRQLLLEWAAVPTMLLCYEVPHRIAQTLHDISELFSPSRLLCIGRELTKRFEEIAVLPVADGPSWLATETMRSRGEFVLIIGMPDAGEKTDEHDPAVQRILNILSQELPPRQAAKLASAITGTSANTLYQNALKSGTDSRVAAAKQQTKIDAVASSSAIEDQKE